MRKIEVIKPSWVIHISHTLSLVQQQLWNVLLAFARDNLAKQAIHSIDVRILQHYLGNKRSIDYLQNMLDALCTIESFNVINKTKQVYARNKFRLLSFAIIEDGQCRYSFSNDLIPHLVNPRSYAKINLLMQKKFKSKHSLIIYELCVDYLHIERTPSFTLAALKTYLGIEPHEYAAFKHFNYKIIKKVISEINKKADLSIEAKFDIKNGDDLIWFTIKKKTRTTIDIKKMVYKAAKQIPRHDTERCEFDPIKNLKDRGISDKRAKQIITLFSTQEIQKVINDVQRNIEKVINPGAFLNQIFNTKEKEKKVMGARKIDTFDYEKQKQIAEHRNFIQNRIQEIWNDLPADRKQSLDAAYEQWKIQQNFAFNFVGSKALYYGIFLEEVLLTPQEKNFDEWMRNK
jgi:hypothetical protein